MTNLEKLALVIGDLTTLREQLRKDINRMEESGGNSEAFLKALDEDELRLSDAMRHARLAYRHLANCSHPENCGCTDCITNRSLKWGHGHG